MTTLCIATNYNSVSATASSGAPVPTCGFYTGGDVWFRATVPVSGNIRIEVTGTSGYNAQYSIYTGACNSLTQYSCNQLDPNRTISDPALALQTIYIRVYNFNSPSGGTFNICVWEPPVPVNDNCINAVLITEGASCSLTTYSNAFATGQSTGIAPDPTCGFYAGGDVWFKFLVPVSGKLRIEISGLIGCNPQYALYSGTCGAFTQIYCGQLKLAHTIVNPAISDQIIYMRVWNYNSKEGGTFKFCIWDPPLPINDDCLNAFTAIVGGTCTMTTFTNAYATPQSTSVATDPTCGFYQGGDVWFKFVAPASGKIRLEFTGSPDCNPQYGLYTGTCGTFTPIYCGQLNPEYTINNPNVGGQTLYLRVWNYSSEDGGTFKFCVWEPPIPANDDCANAVLVTAGVACTMTTYTNAYCTSQATSVATDPTCGFYAGGDVWFKFVAPASGVMRFEFAGLAGCNPQYGVYTGSCGAFTQIYCGQLDPEHTFVNQAVAGQTLYLRVWNYNYDEGGTFKFCVWEPVLPVNDDCVNATLVSFGSTCTYTISSSAYQTSQAANVAPNPTCGFYAGGDVWFKFVAPLSGKIRLQFNGLSGINPQYGLYTGTCGSFTQYYCGQLQPDHSFCDPSIGGQTFYLRVWNYNYDEGGTFQFCITEYPYLGPDTSVYHLCLGGTTNLRTLYDTSGLAVSWNTANPGAVSTGTYRLIVTSSTGCSDTAFASVVLEVATWTGAINSNWHNPSNWNIGKVPSFYTHVIVPGGTANPCIVSNSNATAASIQARNNSNVQVINNRVVDVRGICATLPPN